MRSSGPYGIIETQKRNIAPRSLVRRSELPTSDAARGHAEISADVSDERSTMVQVWCCDCRKVARLHSPSGEDVPLMACGCATFRSLLWRVTNEEKATSSVHFSPLSVLRQPLCSEKRRWHLPQQFQEHHVVCLQQVSCM